MVYGDSLDSDHFLHKILHFFENLLVSILSGFNYIPMLFMYSFHILSY
jgi:hypothetical protein